MSGYAILLFVFLIPFQIYMGIHEVKQGYIGLYKRFGVLQKKYKDPGYHFRIPYVDQFLQVKVTLQTDEVKDIPCGTSNGTLVYFDKIQVVNKLSKSLAYQTVLNYTENYDAFWVTDKIHHEINQFCSRHSLQQIYIEIFDKLDEELTNALNKDLKQWAPGIQILSIRVTKPKIPQRLRKNFQNIQKLKVDYYILAQKQKVLIEEQLTKQKKLQIEASSRLQVKKIQLKKEIQKQQNKLKMTAIEGQMIFQKERTNIEAQFLTELQQVKLYGKLFTNQYLSYLAHDALTSNLTLIIGDKIPGFFPSFNLAGTNSDQQIRKKQNFQQRDKQDKQVEDEKQIFQRSDTQSPGSEQKKDKNQQKKRQNDERRQSAEDKKDKKDKK